MTRGLSTMAFRQLAIEKMRCCKNQRTSDRGQSIGCKAQLLVCPGCANNQKQHADGATDRYAPMPVAAKACGQCENTDRQDENQQLKVKMVAREFFENRQRDQEERQRNTMQHAQTRQRDGRLIKNTGRI